MKKIIKTWINRLGYDISRFDGIGHPRYLSALKKLLKGDGCVIFDVGAHHGQTEKVFSNFFPNSIIYCFEPFESSFSVLKNNVGKSTKIYNIRFSDSVGKQEFQSNLSDATNSLLSLESNASKIWGIKDLSTKESITCEFTTIDEFISSANIEQVDLVKMDVQGAEYKVLRGAKKSLTQKRIKNIYMELIFAPTYVGQWSMEQYIREMSLFGYELYGIYNMCYDENERLLQADVIFTLF